MWGYGREQHIPKRTSSPQLKGVIHSFTQVIHSPLVGATEKPAPRYGGTKIAALALTKTGGSAMLAPPHLNDEVSSATRDFIQCRTLAKP